MPANIQQDPRSLHPLYDKAKAVGLHPEVYERMMQLPDNFFSKKGTEVGGLLGNAAHLAKYTWEGLAFMMIYEMLSYLFNTLVLPPHFRETFIYHNMPAHLKYQPNEAGEYPTLYKHKMVGNEFILTDEVLETEPTQHDILMNGFMAEPTAELGYQKQLESLMDAMQGGPNYLNKKRQNILEKIQSLKAGPSSSNKNQNGYNYLDNTLVNP